MPKFTNHVIALSDKADVEAVLNYHHPIAGGPVRVYFIKGLTCIVWGIGFVFTVHRGSHVFVRKYEENVNPRWYTRRMADLVDAVDAGLIEIPRRRRRRTLKRKAA